MNDRLEAYFKARPNEWIDGRALETIGGGYAWRTRVSDLRLQRGMVIENRCRRIPKLLVPTERVTISEYRWVPESAPEQLSLQNAIDNAEGQA